jgi:hypothetical protein
MINRPILDRCEAVPDDPAAIIMHPNHRYRRQDIRYPGEPLCRTKRCWHVPDTVKEFKGKYIYDRICLSCREQEVARERALRDGVQL